MTKKELKNLLADTALSQNFESNELSTLMMHSIVTSYHPEEILIQQGTIHDKLYIIIDGSAVISAKILGDGVAKIETVSRGNFLNEISFIMQEPSTTSVIVGEKLKCLVLARTYFDFLGLFSQNTKYKIITILTKQICTRIINMHTKLTNAISTLHMTTRSFFGEVIKSLIMPTIVKIEDITNDLIELKNSTAFGSLTKSEIDEIISLSTVITTTKNCTLIQENEINSTCYIVLHGAVQSSIIHDNKIAKLSVIGPMIFFCSLSSVDNTLLSTINFTTCENAILLKISKDSIEKLKTNNIELWHKFFDLICKSIVALGRSIDKLDIRLAIETYNR